MALWRMRLDVISNDAAIVNSKLSTVEDVVR